jgi:hypothetical protein
MRRKARDQRSMLSVVAAAQPNDEATTQIDPRGSNGCRGKMGKQSAA